MIAKLLGNSAVRFLIVGAINTLATVAIFVGLGLVIPPSVAYLVAFAAGLIWVVFGSSRFVFRATGSPLRLVAFAALYLTVFACGQLVIHLLAPRGLTALLITSVVVVAVTTPLNFLGGRFIFRPGAIDGVDAEKEESIS